VYFLIFLFNFQYRFQCGGDEGEHHRRIAKPVVMVVFKQAVIMFVYWCFESGLQTLDF